MKKVLAILILMSVMFVSACGGDVPQLLDFIDANAENLIDYEGYKVQWYFSNSNYDDGDKIYSYDRNTVQGEALLKRLNDIEKSINVEFEFITHLDHRDFTLALLGGTAFADILSYSYMNAMQDLAQGGFLYPVTDFPDYIDLTDTDKYGGANVLEAAMINSVPYSVQPCFWPGFEPMGCFLLCYNKNLVLGNGLTDFHEYWENETWTWETFENEFLKNAYVTSGDGYVPALATWPIAYFDMLMYSNNVQFVTRNAAGENVANIYPDSFIQAYEQGLEWVQNYGDIVDISLSLQDTGPFKDGKVMTALVHSDEVVTGGVAYNESANFLYGIMPFPKGPNAPYGVWAQFVERAPGMGISKYSIEPSIAAHTISLLFEPFEEFGGRDGLESFYFSTFLTETDIEVFFACMEHVRYDYTFWDQSDVGRQVGNDFGVAIKQGKGISEVMERNAPILNEMVYDFILPNFDYMYENYYYQFDQD